MKTDLTVKAFGGYLNIRVGAIIMKNGRLLMAGNKSSEYLYTVGGRVCFGESTEEAVKREVFEETGIHLEVDRLGFVHENFFMADSGRISGKNVYELSFFYYMKVPEDFEPVSKIFDESGSEEFLEWIDIDGERKYYPDFFREELKNSADGIKHIVTDQLGEKVRKELISG